ncbi:ATP-binding protein [Paraburkholderia sediminicola]|uniref:AlbA family DNA-binding domain-containing protein n=1 Tax=Paraburkholderia sediminicola TaxID=458836 RepID=UPI0038BCC239
MLHKADLSNVSFVDLQALKDNQIPESHTLDYKHDFTAERDARASLAADVVAFANTRGGDLILGADERDGFISHFVPIRFDNRDEALRSLQSALVDLIEPKVPAYISRPLLCLTAVTSSSCAHRPASRRHIVSAKQASSTIDGSNAVSVWITRTARWLTTCPA